MNSKHLAWVLAVTGALAAGAAHAGGRPDVQWSVTIGSPNVGVVVGAPVYASPIYAPSIYASPVVVQPVYERYVQVPRYYPQPVVVVPPRGLYRAGWHDADRDGIPDRYDRVYNPRWDRDGDGVPNRYDRHDRNPYRR